MSSQAPVNYQPGVCNIGPSEIAQRRRVAMIGAFASIILLAVLLVSGSSRTTRLFLFFPLVMMSIGWIQSRRRFCLAFGFLGTFNFGKMGELSKVADPAARKADRRVASSILLQGLILASVLTAIIFILPA